jgi:hypothetical protein
MNRLSRIAFVPVLHSIHDSLVERDNHFTVSGADYSELNHTDTQVVEHFIEKGEVAWHPERYSLGRKRWYLDGLFMPRLGGEPGLKEIDFSA